VTRAEAEKRPDALLPKMTLDEKLTLVGGINDFYTQAIPRLGIRQFRDAQAEPTQAVIVLTGSHAAHAPSFRWG
jgi:hypothetical protein